jgi:hypothetical protein
MDNFSPCGPVSKEITCSVPREKLIQKTWRQLIGENFDADGHYITVWAPRQFNIRHFKGITIVTTSNHML